MVRGPESVTHSPVLEEYLDEQPANRKEEDDDGGPTVGVRTNKDSIVSITVPWCILHDLDLFFGALGVSLALLVICTFHLVHDFSTNGRITIHVHWIECGCRTSCLS